MKPRIWKVPWEKNVKEIHPPSEYVSLVTGEHVRPYGTRTEDEVFISTMQDRRPHTIPDEPDLTERIVRMEEHMAQADDRKRQARDADGSRQADAPKARTLSMYSSRIPIDTVSTTAMMCSRCFLRSWAYAKDVEEADIIYCGHCGYTLLNRMQEESV
jgi:hypothetical protein